MASHDKKEEESSPSNTNANGQRYHWKMPQPFCCTTEVLDQLYPLFVYNSLTRSKVRFIPKQPKTINWYHCGPTVYDVAHMGHARTYISLDILRRIFSDIFGYQIVQCQNITDIDDKIIIRSAERGIGFRELASHYEKEFFDDMARLAVRLPDLCTRVSEYIPEIIDFIDVLVKKGIAYEAAGSVYFSVQAFEESGGRYGKLMPEQLGNSALLAEGEGALTSGEEKRAAADFVLWKKTKEAREPSWESPWGPGRPGWHIECSVMARSLTTDNLDIHAGGVDLKFPHHENELAQSEAYSNSRQWVNYWLHTGHLNIQGSKMSKSLKNFITIRQALDVYSPRQVRFLFALHKYNAPMDYSDSTMLQALAVEKIFVEYFHNVKAVLRQYALGQHPQHIGQSDQEMLEAYRAAQKRVFAALCDDFDTPKAISVLLDLIKTCNKFMDGIASASTVVLTSVARYVTSILKAFGLVPAGVDIGFPMDSSSSSASGEESSREAVLTPVLDILATFRQRVRLSAFAQDSTGVLQLADELRDDLLPELGVRLEDKGRDQSVWKLDDPAVLKRERDLKKEAAALKAAAKEEAARKAAEKEARARIPPEMLFRDQSNLYSAFDSQGLPTHDNEGKPLSNSALKKLQKEWQKQKELYEKHVAKSTSSASDAATAPDDNQA